MTPNRRLLVFAFTPMLAIGCHAAQGTLQGSATTPATSVATTTATSTNPTGAEPAHASIHLERGERWLVQGLPKNGVWLLDRTRDPRAFTLGYDELDGTFFLFDGEGKLLATKAAPRASYVASPVVGRFAADGTSAIVTVRSPDGDTTYRWIFADDRVVTEATPAAAGAYVPVAFGATGPSLRDRVAPPSGRAGRPLPRPARNPSDKSVSLARFRWAALVGRRVFVATAEGIVEIRGGDAVLTPCTEGARSVLLAADRGGFRSITLHSICDVDCGPLHDGEVVAVGEDAENVLLRQLDGTFLLADDVERTSHALPSLARVQVGSELFVRSRPGIVRRAVLEDRTIQPNAQSVTLVPLPHEAFIGDVRQLPLADDGFAVPFDDGTEISLLRVDDGYALLRRRGDDVELDDASAPLAIRSGGDPRFATRRPVRRPAN